MYIVKGSHPANYLIHHLTSFLKWDHLRSTLLANFNYAIQSYQLQSPHFTLRHSDLIHLTVERWNPFTNLSYCSAFCKIPSGPLYHVAEFWNQETSKNFCAFSRFVMASNHHPMGRWARVLFAKQEGYLTTKLEFRRSTSKGFRMQRSFRHLGSNLIF